MSTKIIYIPIWLLLMVMCVVLIFSCTQKKETSINDTPLFTEQLKTIEARIKTQLSYEQRKKDSLQKIEQQLAMLQELDDTAFVNIKTLSDYFTLDMRYATTANFLKEAVYPCAKCYVRGSVAKALLKANEDFMKKGYRIKFFDCYRPYSVQKKMWKIFPNPGYVADPRGGSIHNKGAAVDITLTDMDGNEIDMGTAFDYFGKEAHHSYKKLADEVIAHRVLLRETMEKHGFKTIRTEWWHYNYQAGRAFKISDFRWECE